MTEEITRIVIVGGGTAGWLAAATLNKAFNGNGAAPKKTITVIESPDVPIIGVGESTIPSIRSSLSYLDLDERELMRETAATFKNAIKFVQWKESPRTNNRDMYYHPFGAVGHVGATPLIYHWMHWAPPGGRKPRFDYASGPGPFMSDRLLSPKQADSKPFDGITPYAYHIDAVLLGRYLRSICLKRGVVRIEDTVDDVAIAGNGNIEFLATRRNGNIAGDLFIDCTGFARAIIGRMEQDNFISYANTLLCDTALAVQIPYEPEKAAAPNSFTTATAQRAGWIWDIQLQSRRGIGYVHSSAYTSGSQAEQEILAYIGPRAKAADLRKIPMKLGRNRAFWSRNCVALGLATGFVEPLESTGIFVIEAGLMLLRHNFPDKRMAPALQRRYNQSMATIYDEVRDFIVLHYCLTQREDSPFWRANKFDLNLSDRLKENLEVWAERPPLDSDFEGPIRAYGAAGYNHVLYGMGRLPRRLPEFIRTASPKDIQNIHSLFVKIGKDTQNKLAKLIPQADFLRGLAA